MTGRQWRKCGRVEPMLECLSGKASPRKLRLFAVACCRSIWHHLMDDARHAVEVAEQFADGQATSHELMQARQGAHEAIGRISWAHYFRTLFNHQLSNAEECAERAAVAACEADAFEAARATSEWTDSASDAALLREIIGSPFRQRGISAAWLSWQEGVVVHLARAAYEERRSPEGNLDNHRLAVLADALEEAGCADTKILLHLRQRGEHFRGCWAVDLPLEKS